MISFFCLIVGSFVDTSTFPELCIMLAFYFRFKERSFGSGGATSGLTSSLAFTPVQVCPPFSLIDVHSAVFLVPNFRSLKILHFGCSLCLLICALGSPDTVCLFLLAMC